MMTSPFALLSILGTPYRNASEMINHQTTRIPPLGMNRDTYS